MAGSRPRSRRRVLAAGALAAVLLLAGCTATVAPGAPTTDASTPTPDATPEPAPTPDATPEPTDPTATGPFAQFESAAALRAQVTVSNGNRFGPQIGVVRPQPTVSFTTDAREDAETARGAPSRGGGDRDVPRYSETNVRERGIDEPAILKTDGRYAYYAGVTRDYHGGWEGSTSITVLNVTEPGDPSVDGRVARSGRFLLTEDRLVVFDDDAIYGYDRTEPAAPTRVWRHRLNGSQVDTARLLNGTVYLVTTTGGTRTPCPVRPLGDVTVPCKSVHYPRDGGGDTIYTVSELSPRNGTVNRTTSVVAGGSRGTTYVSEHAIYLTYDDSTDRATAFLRYLSSEGSPLDEQARERLASTRALDISTRARATEADRIVTEWAARQDDPQAARNRLSQSFRQYRENNQRAFQRTGIAEIELDTLEPTATGSVPGTPLNQFAIDERDGRLRIATTVDAAVGFGVRATAESENDLYVLNRSLSVVGSVQGMAPGQRVYSVRYVGDTAYVVTFRQIDPFHVVDLSKPTDPVELGQVELPGFSRYLHPVSEDRVLGIGREDGQVKAVLFDVSEPTEPRVADSRVLDADWSAISRTHHAFLQDPEHGVFFLPAGDEAYVFGYEDGLTLERRVDTFGQARRALYVDDYMYVFGGQRVTVLDERDWSIVDRLDLD